MGVLLFLACQQSDVSNSKLPVFDRITLHVDDVHFEVAWASKPHERALGLRHRELGLEDGLLLKIDGGLLSMKGMKSPISAALMSSDGMIQDIWTMGLGDEARPIPDSAKYILEMHDTWFVRHQIKRDMRVLGLPE